MMAASYGSVAPAHKGKLQNLMVARASHGKAVSRFEKYGAKNRHDPDTTGILDVKKRLKFL
jgi:hypothetical protein